MSVRIGTNTVSYTKYLPQSTGKYKLRQVIQDDNGTDVGVVVGFQFDSNGKEYAVVCLLSPARINLIDDGQGNITASDTVQLLTTNTTVTAISNLGENLYTMMDTDVTATQRTSMILSETLHSPSA